MGGGIKKRCRRAERGRTRALAVVWLQSVGMRGGSIAVAGAALEAVVVLLLFQLLLLLFPIAIADAVPAVGLTRRQIHALDVHVHVCTQQQQQQQR